MKYTREKSMIMPKIISILFFMAVVVICSQVSAYAEENDGGKVSALELTETYEIEPNDSMGYANELYVDAIMYGSSKSIGDNDWYVVKVSKTTKVEVTFHASEYNQHLSSIEVYSDYPRSDDSDYYAITPGFTKTVNYVFEKNKSYYMKWMSVDNGGAYSISIANREKTVEFVDANKTIKSKSVLSGAKIGTLPTPTKTGYTFKGWYTKNSGGTKITSSTKVKDDVSYYAQWTAKKYKITYNVNGGKALSTKSKTVTFGNAYGKLATPTRKGYTFKGWYTAKSGGSLRADATKVSTAKAHTLYAHWTIAKYTLTYNVNGGDALSPASKTITYNSKYGTLATPTRMGYTFKGWFTSKTGTTRVTKNVKVTKTANHSIYAHWSAKSYTVTLDVNGGKALSSTDKTKKVTFDKVYGALKSTTRSGYTFKGWYTSKVDGEKITEKTVLNKALGLAKNHTLYAQWIANTYTVTFDVNGGDALDSSLATKNVLYASEFGTLPIPTRTGYTFDGWYTAKSGGTEYTDVSIVNILKATTLYAHWSEVEVLANDINEEVGEIVGEEPISSVDDDDFPSVDEAE